MAGAPKRHNVVVMGSNGEPEMFPMKEWLRRNPGQLPPELDPTSSTSYQVRRALRKRGWELEELQDQVLLIRPDERGDTSFADTILSEAGGETEASVEDEITEAQEITFGLERDLQAALRKNLAQLEQGLRITDGGKENVTKAGRIDITAQDARGTPVVIELKAGIAPQQVVTQILAYMSTVAEGGSGPVRGIIIAGDFPDRVILAARAVPTLELRRYTFQFSFEAVK